MKKKKKIMNGLTSGVVYKFLYRLKGGCIKNVLFFSHSLSFDTWSM